MTTFFALLLAILTFAFIAYPLFKGRFRPVVASDNDAERELLSKRDTTYSMLKELEFDYQSGILAEEDYRELEKKYKEKAISTLKQIDSVSQDKAEELDEIEKEVRRLRRRRATAAPRGVSKVANVEKGKDEGEDELEKEIRRLRRSQDKAVAAKMDGDVEREIPQQRQGDAQVRYCTQCGSKAEASDRFCSHCGTSLRGKEKAN